MIVHLAPHHCSVSDADTLTDLRVVTPLGDVAELRAAVQRTALGELDPDSASHVFVDVERLRALARESATLDDWDRRFDDMIAYAGRKGWLDVESGKVRAHVEFLA